MRVIVVGAGIVGASVAWHLAHDGAEVTVLEQGAAPACGVTAQAFGWVGLGAQGPGDDPELFALRLRALPEHDRWRAALGTAYPVSGQGALVWQASAARTRALIGWHRALGNPVVAVEAAQIAEMEPALRPVPPLAALFEQDVASEPPALARAVLADAVARGAQLRTGARVREVVPGAAVLEGGARVEGDCVVLANGAGAAELVPGLDLAVSPAVLIPGWGPARLSGRILCGPEFEFRQAADGRVMLAEWLPEAGEAGLPALVAAAGDALARGLGEGGAAIRLEPPQVGRRPVTGDGWPMLGWVPGRPGLYLAVAHPGVILAPFLGRCAAAEILRGDHDPEVGKFRPRPPVIG